MSIFKKMTVTNDTRARLQTGIAGLDTILNGGLPRGHMYLIEGDPGTGKTTLAMQFLLANANGGRDGLYVTLSETRRELKETAVSHGWSLEHVPVLELTSDELGGQDSQYTVFHPSEVELISTLRRMLDEVERLNTSCVVLDSLSELRLLAGDSVRYRRQLLALKSFFAQRDTTVLILDDRTGDGGSDKQLQSIAHGVIRLQKLPRDYGATRRNLEILKVRGSAFRDGTHDYVIRAEGVVVFPRVMAADYSAVTEGGGLLSGIPALDDLLGGGMKRGSSNLLIGPTGVGKSTIAALYATAAAARGERAMIFTFDELPTTLTTRCQSLGIEIEAEIERKTLSIVQVDPAEMSPGEFAGAILDEVSAEPGLKVLVLDSLTGYVHAMSGEKETILHLHELLTCLAMRGVTTIMSLAQHGLIGMEAGTDVSYLTDSVLLMRYFEAAGQLRQAISVMKNRSARHRNTIHELMLGPGRISVGEPLIQFQGVMTGIPSFIQAQPLEVRYDQGPVTR